MNTCSQCGGKFESQRVTAKFCGVACRMRNLRGLRHKPNLLREELADKALAAILEPVEPSQADGGVDGAEAVSEAKRGNGRVEVGRVRPELPRHLRADYLKTEPLVFYTDLSKAQLRERLDRIKSYNAYQLSIGQEFHCTTRQKLESMLARSGYDWRLAKGVGWEAPESQTLKEIADASVEA